MSASAPLPHASLPDNPLGWLLLARQLAVQAGTLAMSLRHAPSATSTATPLAINSKTASIDLVTSADMASQNLIFSALAQAFPSHRLIGEEDAQYYGELDERPTWIVDAVDGTTNFVHGLRDWAVSIAFVKCKVVEIGVVYCVGSGELFCGVRGCGAYMNDGPIRASGAQRLSEAVIVSEWGYEREEVAVERMLAVNRRLLRRNVRGPRQLGSGALDMCYVGMGRIDGVYCGVAGESWKIWDYAAASLIAKEAGAELRTVEGGEFCITCESMVCAAPGVLRELLEVIQG